MTEKAITSHHNYITSAGKLYNKLQGCSKDGLLTALVNEPTRGRTWSMLSSCVHQNSGVFAITDERGQVYQCCVDKNDYFTVRTADNVISAMEFIHSRQTQMALSYEKGQTVIIDTETREVIQNIQPQSLGSVRLMRAHPCSPTLALVTDTQVVEVWDLRVTACIRSLECAERIMEVLFVLDGRAILVMLEHSGAYIYNSSDWSLISHCVLPASERIPRWTGVTTWVPESTANHPQNNSVNSRKSDKTRTVLGASTVPSSLMVLLSADNGMLYLFGIEGIDFSNNRSRQGDVAQHQIKLLTVLIGIIELPVKVQMVVAFASVGDPDCPPRISMLTNEGGMLIVDVTSCDLLHIGTWTVVADVTAIAVQGDTGSRVQIKPFFIPPDYHRARDAAQERRDGVFISRGDLLFSTGVDGAIRVFDSEACIGVGSICGLLLRGRRPYNESVSGNIRQDVDVPSTLPTGSDARKQVADEKEAKALPIDPQKRRIDKKLSPAISKQTREAKVSTTRPQSAPSRRGNGVNQTLSKTNSTVESSRRIERSQIVRSPRVADSSSTKGKTSTTGSSQSQEENPNTMPVFRLAMLTKDQQRINHKKLVVFLEKNGEFPSKYRTLIWRFLLKLPENCDAFSDLVRRGVHPGFDNLHRLYPISSERMFSRLQQVCSQLAHWSPIFGELSYIPSFAFPFVVLFGSDELATLETCMTILMWWGYSWHATFPNPPLHITDAVDALLKFHDENLYGHLRRMGVAAGLVGWTLISTLFTEILGREDWLKFMDYIFAHFHRSELMIVAPVALLRAVRTSLLTAGDASHILGYCRHQQGLNIKDTINFMHIMVETTPNKYFAACPQHSLTVAQHDAADRKRRGMKLAPEHTTDEKASAQENMALQFGNPVFPIPVGRYPAYDGHPTFLVDWELKNRDRALALQQEVNRREDVLKNLQTKIQKMEDDHAQWMMRHQAATDAEIMHRKAMMDAEKKHLFDLQRIEQEISRQRIHSLNTLEVTAAEEMELMDKLALDAKKLLAESESHLSEKMELTLNIQKHRELAEAAESITHEKLNKIHMRRARDEWVKGMATSIRGKEDEFESKNLLLQESWQKQDEEMRMQRAMRTERSRNFVQTEELDRLHDEMSTRLQKLHLAREAKILEIERARAVRLAKEQAEEALEASERSALLLKKQELAASTESAAWLAENGVRQAQARLQSTVEMVKQESEKLLEMERAHELRQHQSQIQARTAILRKEWADKQAEQLRQVLDAESELQQQILQLQRANIKAQMNQNLAGAAVLDEARSSGRVEQSALNRTERAADNAVASAKSDIEQMGDEVLQRQRARFQEMKREMEIQQLKQQVRPRYETEATPAPESSMDASSAHSSPANQDQGNPRWFASPDQPVPRARPRSTHQSVALSSSHWTEHNLSESGQSNQSFGGSRSGSVSSIAERRVADIQINGSSPDSEHSASNYSSDGQSGQRSNSRLLPLSKTLREASTALLDSNTTLSLSKTFVGRSSRRTSGSSAGSPEDINISAVVPSLPNQEPLDESQYQRMGTASTSRIVSTTRESRRSSTESGSESDSRFNSHRDHVTAARAHDFDEFVRQGGIGRHAGLRSPPPSDLLTGSNQVSRSSHVTLNSHTESRRVEQMSESTPVVSDVGARYEPKDPPSGYSAPWALDSGSGSDH